MITSISNLPQVPSSSGPAFSIIYTKRGQAIIVDQADYDELSKYAWHAIKIRNTWYAERSWKENNERHNELMHRRLVECKPGFVVDHINGNGLDNRRCNLRSCTVSQNRANSHHNRVNKAPYIGVYPDGPGWDVNIRIGGRMKFLGYFADPIEAAKARDKKALEIYGPHVRLNFPPEGKPSDSNIMVHCGAEDSVPGWDALKKVVCTPALDAKEGGPKDHPDASKAGVKRSIEGQDRSPRPSSSVL